MVHNFDIQKNNAVVATKKLKEILSDVISIDIVRPEQFNSDDIYKKIWLHRSNYYQAHAPHLLNLKERALEAKLDQRGLLFSISKNNIVLASVRLIQAPFELEAYQCNGFNFSGIENYWEISRLVTHPNLDIINKAVITQYLLCIAGLEVFTKQKCHGLIGLCKASTLNFFIKFGLIAAGKAYNKSRNINYHIITGDIYTILNSTEKIILKHEKIQQRLAEVLV